MLIIIFFLTTEKLLNLLIYYLWTINQTCTHWKILKKKTVFGGSKQILTLNTMSYTHIHIFAWNTVFFFFVCSFLPLPSFWCFIYDWPSMKIIISVASKEDPPSIINHCCCFLVVAINRMSARTNLEIM